MKLLGLLSVAALVAAAVARSPSQRNHVCPSAYTMIAGRCFLVSEEAYSGLQAANHCQLQEGWPAVVETQEEMDLLKDFAGGNSFYLGIDLSNRKAIVEGVLKASQHSGYTNFKSEEPDNAGGEDCVVADSREDFQWMDVSCSSDFRVLCETASVPERLCEEDAHKFNDDTCFYVSKSSSNYTEAHVICKDRGMEMASLHSAEEHDFASNLLTSDSWIGLDDFAALYNYAWTDGTPLDFEMWCNGEPNHYYESKEEHCGEIRKGSGGFMDCWNDNFCGYSRAVICRGPTH